MEERLNELGGLWASYQITRDVETLYKASKFNSDVFFEFLGGDIPSICHDIIKESDERKYDLLTWRAKTLMEKPNVMRAYQMFQYYTNLIIREEELTGKANPNGLKIEALIINVYDLIQEYATEIERLSDIIYQEIPEEIEEGDYNDIDRVLRLNVACEHYKKYLSHIRDLIDDLPKLEDEVNQNHASGSRKLPKELDNPKAKEVLQRGIKANLLDENYQLLKGVTQGQAYLFALYASQELRIYNQWKVFGGSLWGIKNLGKVKLESTRDEKLDVVRNLFSEKIIKDAMMK